MDNSGEFRYTEGNTWELKFMQDLKNKLCDSQGNLSNSQGTQGNVQGQIDEILKDRLKQWKDVEINFGITGDCGAGKSSFINAIRELADDDEGAARTGVNETTREAAVYRHPTNPKIMFSDLPGIGTPNYPDLETYCDKVDLEKYDAFLILTAGRFTQNDLLLAGKVKFFKKSFFFIRTKIDLDVWNESRKKNFNEEKMLKEIREKCLENLRDLGAGDEDVFLISNHDREKWDFARLRQDILNALTLHQKECLTLSLSTSTREMLKEKANLLRGRIWMVAAVSAAAETVSGLPVAFNLIFLREEVDLYKSQLGLPEENSHEFQRMTPKTDEKFRKFPLTSAIKFAKLLNGYGVKNEQFARFIWILGRAIAASISFSSTCYFLHEYLNEIEETALESLDKKNTRVVNDL